jgi:hypothetical protein
MLNLIKRWGIGVVDLANDLLDPYDDFTRIFLPPEDNTTLYDRGSKFLIQLLGDFRQPNGLFLYNRAKAWEDPDFGDTAVHHGLAAAALSFAFQCKSVSPAAVADAANAVRFLFEGGKLIRGRHPRDTSKIADDPSNDTATGALAGIYFPAKYGDPNAGMAGIDHIRMLADELIANDYALVRQDGTKTTHGKLISGALTVPQLSSLALAIFRVAGVMTGNRVYNEHFAKLNKKYGSLLRFAEFKFLDYTKSHESHRCALHLHILATEAQDNRELAERCAAGLARIWKLHRKTRDPWLAALVNQFWRIPQSDMDDVIRRLYEYPVAGKPPQRETLNSKRFTYWKERGVRFINVAKKIGGEKVIRASQPLPYHMQPTQDFWPQRHPYGCDGFEGSNDDFVRHNAVDFLAPYYLLRMQHVIREDQ